MKKNILITGANGFIGKKLQKRLLSAEYNIITHDIENSDISVDILNYTNIDHIFHLAALMSVPDSWNKTFDFYKTNFMGTVNVLELCRKTGASLTFMSTYVYGKPNQILIDENHDLNPNTPYNHSKVICEDICSFYNKMFDINITVLRPFNVYGYGQSSSFLIPYVIEQFLDKNTEIVSVMDLNSKRDYIYIDDLIEAMYKTINCNGYNIFNVGTGYSTSVYDVLNYIKNILKSDKTFTSKNIERKNEVSDMAADISKIKKLLDWEPQYNIEKGLEKTIKEYKEASY